MMPETLDSLDVFEQLVDRDGTIDATRDDVESFDGDTVHDSYGDEQPSAAAIGARADGLASTRRYTRTIDTELFDGPRPGDRAYIAVDTTTRSVAGWLVAELAELSNIDQLEPSSYDAIVAYDVVEHDGRVARFELSKRVEAVAVLERTSEGEL